MTDDTTPFDRGALERAVPRYTSYPTAPHFGDGFDPAAYARWLDEIAADKPVSLYLHIPFCDELCWFCACRTQGTRRYAAVSRYLDCLEAEIGRVAEHLGGARPVTQMHWGGGSPTVMHPEDTARLRETMRRAFPGTDAAEFAVEIDPRDMSEERLDAFAAAGITRASIGVQDFDETVQKAIGRLQGREMTERVIGGLRERGVESVNIDLLYGLPHQTVESLERTIAAVVALAPDRIALFGYAHVPWMAKRQKMIDQATLPQLKERWFQSERARDMLLAAGYEAVGIDHFAKPGDALALAAREGTLRRNFQGYTVDSAEALIGMGASAIGSLPQGYVQNEPVTADYQKAIAAGGLPVRRGCALSLEDQMRRTAIEQILCGFALDLDALKARFGDFVRPLADRAEWLKATAPEGALEPRPGGFTIAPAWRKHARLIAAEFDAYLQKRSARHSVAL
jgi:oxygen-independent coproporphyrinogen-3 oxidase